MQSELEEAEECADIAESQINKMKVKGRDMGKVSLPAPGIKLCLINTDVDLCFMSHAAGQRQRRVMSGCQEED